MKARVARTVGWSSPCSPSTTCCCSASGCCSPRSSRTRPGSPPRTTSTPTSRRHRDTALNDVSYLGVRPRQHRRHRRRADRRRHRPRLAMQQVAAVDLPRPGRRRPGAGLPLRAVRGQAPAPGRQAAGQRHPDLELPERPHRRRDGAVRRQRTARRLVRTAALAAHPRGHGVPRGAAARRVSAGSTAARTTSPTSSRRTSTAPSPSPSPRVCSWRAGRWPGCASWTVMPPTLRRPP